jgi:hypothetical protein
LDRATGCAAVATGSDPPNSPGEIKVTEQESQKIMLQLIDLHINPLAQVVTQLAAVLVKSQAITKDDARFSVANAINVINPLEYSNELKEDAASTLQRMLSALDGLPD